MRPDSLVVCNLQGADGGLDVGAPGDGKKAPWYTAPVRWFGSAPEAIHQIAWRGKGESIPRKRLVCDATYVHSSSAGRLPWVVQALMACSGSVQSQDGSCICTPTGDVYHLLFDLSQKIHGRVWPEKDRAAVKRLLSLIRHVCGAILDMPLPHARVHLPPSTCSLLHPAPGCCLRPHVACQLL